MWTWNATYHSVRARGLLSAFFYLRELSTSKLQEKRLTNFVVGPTIIGPVQGYLLDRPAWRRRSRARIATASFAIVSLLICKLFQHRNVQEGGLNLMVKGSLA